MLSESQVGKVTIHNNDMKIPTRTYTYILAFTRLKVKLIKGKFYDWYRYQKKLTNCPLATIQKRTGNPVPVLVLRLLSLF